ncbi:hypothetical protein [Tenacibaculum xiamenense]|uniref:hypothetical protein n=1 Tax=Tenacibaculum xiamenense TaxID=1261553 RepID=UPI00389357FF
MKNRKIWHISLLIMVLHIISCAQSDEIIEINEGRTTYPPNKNLANYPVKNILVKLSENQNKSKVKNLLQPDPHSIPTTTTYKKFKVTTKNIELLSGKPISHFFDYMKERTGYDCLFFYNKWANSSKQRNKLG